MKNNYKKSAPGRDAVHIAAIAVFVVAASFVCLIAAGFIGIRLPGGSSDTERTKTPGELAYESYLAGLTSAPYSHDTKTPEDTTGGTTTRPRDDAPVVYPSIDALIADGYRVTYEPVSSGMKLAAILPGGRAMPYEHSFGTLKIVKVLRAETLEEGGQLYESITDEVTVRNAIEPYMGYILYDNGDMTISIYRADGSLVCTLDDDKLNPAYTRDSQNRPLFTSGGKYYYLDENACELVEVDFDRKFDGRGLFFDYAPNYGINDDERFGVLWQREPVTLSYLLDRSSYYTRFKVDPRVARVLYELDPDFAEKVAVRQAGGHYYNYPFKLALDKAKADIERERAEAATAESAAPTPEPVTEPLPETTGEDITVPDTPPVPDEPAYPVTDATTGTGTETEAPTETDVPTETEAPYDPMLEVSVTFDAPRYYYGPSLDNPRFGGGYAHAYAFSEGYACVVDDYGVLKVINTSGRVTARLRYEYRTDAAHGYTYMVRTYYQPFYQDIYSLGYYYFDHGLMRVRVLEHELNEGDVVNYITADYDILIDPYGNEFELPAGYRLVSYSEGILLLERDGRYGYYHRDGYWVAQPVYTYAMPFVEGIGILGDADGPRGAIDAAGNVIIPFDYEEITTPSSGVIACYSESDGWLLLAKVSQ